MEKIKDEFGKKIGGSKRDLWKNRNLCIEDLLDMNEREVETYVKKDNVWKKPDYEKMVKEDGVDREIVYYIKLVEIPFQQSLRTAVKNITTIFQKLKSCWRLFPAWQIFGRFIKKSLNPNLLCRKVLIL